ncbi:Uncharacterized protein SCF082_LOCUS2412 [Durusdinium trenchii]|uniref:Uncharacterized protein n=1 Tax=Durusdinium trenchii TaxID=1381693 RepID=A0ABP0HKV1_9DINO
MVLGGFDLLRWRRGSPSELSGLQGTQAAPAEAEVPDQTDPGAEMARPSGPFEMTAIGTDPRVGLWWYIHESKILLFQLPGQQWPPCSVVPLPSTVAAQCVAPLTGAVQQGTSQIRTPTVAVLYDDAQLSVFPHGRRVDLPKATNWPFGEVPLLIRAAAPHPHAVGVALVVVTQSGRLLSLFLAQSAHTFEVEASRLWPMVSEHCLKNFFKRIRRYGFGDVSQDRHSLEDAQFLAHQIEILPAQRRGSLFDVLAWGEEHLALYSHPRSTAPADLMWVSSLAHLVTGDVVPGRFLSVCCNSEASKEKLLVFFTGEDPTRGPSAMLTRLSLPSRAAPPEPSLAVASVAPKPSDGRGLMTAFGDVAVTAVQVDSERYCICLVNMPPWPAALQAGVQQIVEFGIAGLSLLPEGVSVGHIQVLTPHGLLSCPQDMFGGDKELEGKAPSTADAFLQVASDFFDAGQEDQASSLCGRAFSQMGAQAMLAAVERRTQHLLDSGDETNVAAQLSKKSKSLAEWLRFLHQAGVWIRMGNAPNITAAQQKMVEACERISALQQMQEYHDLEPDVFASSIHHALDTKGGSKSPEEEALEFYGRPSECERLLSSLAEYPRTLPFGSGGAWDAVVFVHGVVCGFIEAALERRSHILKAHPTSLPPPDSHQLQRYWPRSAPSVKGVGSGWLMAPSVQRALEEIRSLSLEVLPVPKQRLPLLDAQALRVVEGLQQLCRSTLRAAHASFVDLHASPMAKLREAVLKDMAHAEASLHENAKMVKHRTLGLAEEFEDVEAFVRLSAWSDLPRLDGMMESEAFRRRVFEQRLAEKPLHPLFFRMVRCFPPTKAALEELLLPYPELRWTLELNRLNEVGQVGISPWPNAMHSVKEIAIKAMERGDASKDEHRSKALKALASIASLAQEEPRVVRCS